MAANTLTRSLLRAEDTLVLLRHRLAAAEAAGPEWADVAVGLRELEAELVATLQAAARVDADRAAARSLLRVLPGGAR